MPFWLYPLLIAAPLAPLAEFAHASPLIIFLLAALAIIPLAGLISDATESLSERVGSMVGGLLNATFGNAPELIIGLATLAAGLPDVVRATIAGGIIGNALFGLGSSMFAGGWRYGLQRFPERHAGQYALMLALAVVGLAIPSLLATVGSGAGGGSTTVHGLALHEMSLVVAALLLVSYAGYLAFTVFGVRADRQGTTGRAIRRNERGEQRPGEQSESHEAWAAGPQDDQPILDLPASISRVAREAAASAELAVAGKAPERGLGTMVRRWRASGPWFDIGLLAVATALIAVESEILSGAITPLSRDLHLNSFFVGLIVLPLVGGAAEFTTAVRAALADHMEAALAVAAGSSIQIALLIAPVLILISPLLGQTLDLDFTRLELVIFGLVAGLFALISLDGESTWLEGMQLCVFYLIVAVGSFFLPR